MFQKEALFWGPKDNNNIQCLLCPRECHIAPGQVGFCKVRKNENGDLYSLVYGACSAIAVDPIEKKPLKQFFPGTKVFSVGTVGCNLDCKHCQNWQISHTDISYKTEFISPLNLIDVAKKNNCDGIAWTYNEPTVWFEFSLDSAILAKEHGLYTVYVTNGYINTAPIDQIGPYLDAFCVDIKGFSDLFYKDICGINNWQNILNVTQRVKDKWGVHVEIVTNIIPQYNDNDDELTNLAKWIKNNLGSETAWHITRFFPNFKLRDLPFTPLETLQRAKSIGEKVGLKKVFLGNV